MKIPRIILYSQIQLLLLSSIRVISSDFEILEFPYPKTGLLKHYFLTSSEKNIDFPLCKNLILDQIGSFRGTVLGFLCISLHVLKQANTCLKNKTFY